MAVVERFGGDRQVSHGLIAQSALESIRSEGAVTVARAPRLFDPAAFPPSWVVHRKIQVRYTGSQRRDAVMGGASSMCCWVGRRRR
jgi:hypothetical protein